MKNRLARLWYKFKNWFRTKPGEPLTFLCGSEEELRRVTTWMYHICAYEVSMLPGWSCGISIIPDFSVCYFATPQEDSCGQGRHRFFITPFGQIEGAETQRLQKWCSLIVEYNRFVGTYFSRRPERRLSYHLEEMHGLYYREYLSEQEYCDGFLSREELFEIRITVQPPSAHERAEALLSLSEWLDGKVSEQEKRELFQMV